MQSVVIMQKVSVITNFVLFTRLWLKLDSFAIF